MCTFVLTALFVWSDESQPLQLLSASGSCPSGKQADQLAAGACKVQHTHKNTHTLCDQYLIAGSSVADIH